MRESETRFRLLVEGTEDYAIFMLDPAGTVASWNLGAERMMGYGSGEIIGRHFSCFYPAEDFAQDKPQRELEFATQEGRAEDRGWRVRRDGSRYYAHAIITALRDKSGQLRGFSKVTRDITEQRQAEMALQSYAAQRAAVAELGQRGLEGTDPDALMKQAAVLVAQSLGVEFSRVMELLPDGKSFLLRAGAGWEEGLVGKATIGAGTDSAAGYAVMTRQPVMVEDLAWKRVSRWRSLFRDRGIDQRCHRSHARQRGRFWRPGHRYHSQPVLRAG